MYYWLINISRSAFFKLFIEYVGNKHFVSSCYHIIETRKKSKKLQPYTFTHITILESLNPDQICQYKFHKKKDGG